MLNEASSPYLDLQKGRKQCIFVVEDELDIRRTLKTILEGEGFEVYTAQNGLDALETLRTIPHPSLILLDLMMPVMDGYDFSNKLGDVEKYANIPIVVLTAFSRTAQGMRCTEILRKPMDLNELLAKVDFYTLRGNGSRSA